MSRSFLPPIATKSKPVKRVNGLTTSSLMDTLSVEEPLEIRITYQLKAETIEKSISVTMRTPGNDSELALGFLFTEGIISSTDNVVSTHLEENVISVVLANDFTPILKNADRNFYTTSSCGVCGKGSIASIRTVSPFSKRNKPVLQLDTSVFYELPQKLKAAQSGFAATGGHHASGLFSAGGELLLLREDVGRHNALDKLIGHALTHDMLPLEKHILLLSGRASFELIQKAAMAGISVVAAIGAPSSLAVELAAEFNMTLLGFLRNDRFNIYTSSESFFIPDIV